MATSVSEAAVSYHADPNNCMPGVQFDNMFRKNVYWQKIRKEVFLSDCKNVSCFRVVHVDARQCT